MTFDMSQWPSTRLVHGKVELLIRDSGGEGPCVLLIHGLAGHSLEWSSVAEPLSGACRVVAVDQRGHGGSSPSPSDASREAHVTDLAAVATQLGLGPVTLVGQSMGAHTALLFAATHPALVQRLVLIEGGVGGEGPQASHKVIDWFKGWPTPFPDRDHAIRFFGGGLGGAAWADGLQETPDGLVPRFNTDFLLAALLAVHTQARWSEWQQISCPILVIKGGQGFLPAEELEQMLATNPLANFVEFPEAGHDVHLDDPAGVTRTLTEFLTHDTQITTLPQSL